MLSPRQKFIKRIVLPLALVVFIGLFVTDALFVPQADSAQIDRQIKIISSQIADTPGDISISKDLNPRIDSEAAMIERVIRSTPACFTPLEIEYLNSAGIKLQTDPINSGNIKQEFLTGQALPGELWILLLAAYLFLLFFNLFFDFERAAKIHWFWESLYTILALWGWYVWDSCHQNLWFPLYVLKLGSLVYLVYLYLFYKQKELRPLSDEDLENFEG